MRSLALAVALVAPGAAFALPIPLHLADGATWTMTSTHEREVRNGPDPSFSVTVVKRLTWRPGKTGGGLLHQEHVSTTANSGIPPELAFTQTLSIPIDFEVDDDLAPIRIKNADEAREAALALMAKAGGDQKASVWPPETKKRILDAMIQALVARDLHMIAGGQDTDLALGEAVEAVGDVESPIGGPPLKVLNRVLLESYDAKAGKAVVVITSDLDPKSFAGVAGEMARQLAPNAKPAPTPNGAGLDVKLSSRCRSEIDLATGLALETKCESARNVSSAEDHRASIDRWTITQTLPGHP